MYLRIRRDRYATKHSNRLMAGLEFLLGDLQPILDVTDLSVIHDKYQSMSRALEDLGLVSEDTVFHSQLQKGRQLIIADFPYWTVSKIQVDTYWKKINDQMFQAGAKYILLTDSGLRNLALNVETYVRRMSDKPDIYQRLMELFLYDVENYLNALGEWIYLRYTYTMRKCTYTRDKAYCLFELSDLRQTHIPGSCAFHNAGKG